MFWNKAGNSIDVYCREYSNTDYIFHSSNNAITSYNGSIDFENIKQSSVIDISGSTSNDGRYKVATSNTNVMKVDGFQGLEKMVCQNLLIMNHILLMVQLIIMLMKH